jgi:KDO2-lipid IV(A) lauroyltransferase
VCSWIAWSLPRRARYWVADRLGELLYRLSPTYRHNVQDNLFHVLDLPHDSPEVTAAAQQIFRVSSRNFADLLTVPRESNQEINRRVDVIRGSYSLLDAALDEGKGALIISGHLGAFDILGQVLHARGYKLTVVTARTTARGLFDAVTYLRGKRGMNLVEATPSGVRRAISAVRRGEIAVFVTDRDFFQSGRQIDFFGEPTTLPLGAVRIAREADAPIVPIFAERVPGGHGITILPAFRVPRTGNPDADLSAGISRIATTLEEAIGRSPDQWVMFQKVWPSAPADPVRVFPVGSPLESELLERVDAAIDRRLHPGPKATTPTPEEDDPTNRTESPR